MLSRVILILVFLSSGVARSSNKKTTLAHCLQLLREITPNYDLSKYGLTLHDLFKKTLLKNKQIDSLNLMHSKFNKSGLKEIRKIEPELPEANASGIYYYEQYKEIQKLFNDHQRFFNIMQDLEVAVMNLRNADTSLDSQAAIRIVFEKIEFENGFSKAIALKTDIDYNGKAWHAMLSEGRMFEDTLMFDDRGHREGHGYLTHRLQWFVVMRDIQLRPKLYKKNGQKVLGVDLFTGLGNFEKQSKFAKNNKTGYLWDLLFDNYNPSFHSPDFLHRMHHYWPVIGDWH